MATTSAMDALDAQEEGGVAADHLRIGIGAHIAHLDLAVLVIAAGGDLAVGDPSQRSSCRPPRRRHSGPDRPLVKAFLKLSRPDR